jgi:hypothetical protein
MKKTLAILSSITLMALASTAHAQIISADFSETLLDTTGTNVAGSPWSSTGTLSLGTSGGGVTVTLDSTGLITLADATTGTFQNLTINLSNITFSDPSGVVVGITPVLAGAFTDTVPGSSLIAASSFTSNSASLNFFTISPANQLTLTGGVSTYQLTIVPEPRDWALMILAGLAGLVIVRKLGSRYFPGFSFAVIE